MTGLLGLCYGKANSSERRVKTLWTLKELVLHTQVVILMTVRQLEE